MEAYKVIALDDLVVDHHTWTKGLDYEVQETDTKFSLTSNEGQLSYVIRLKKTIMENFKEPVVFEYSQEDCIRDTKEHISQVRYFMITFAQELMQRALVHDQSKLESPELEVFTEYTPKLKDSTYGSEEYKSFLKGMSEGLSHHYANNSHHPEHYDNGVRGMDLADIVEMLCDWKAATMRHANGDITKSIELNKNRFDYSDDLEQIFKNSTKMFEKE